MRKRAGDLYIGEPFKYEEEIYIPISSYTGELYAIKLENLTRIPLNMLIDSIDTSLVEKEDINEKED